MVRYDKRHTATGINRIPDIWGLVVGISMSLGQILSPPTHPSLHPTPKGPLYRKSSKNRYNRRDTLHDNEEQYDKRKMRRTFEGA